MQQSNRETSSDAIRQSPETAARLRSFFGFAPSLASHRRGTGLLRAIVIAAAAGSILLVCFSIYQYSQLQMTAPAKTTAPRLPATPTRPELDPPPTNAADAPSVMVGSTPIGPGRNVRLSIYSPEGQKARAEIAVASWTPAPGSLNQFLLVDPEVRLRTSSGNAVRVTSKKGTMEAQRHGAGGLDPLRGELTGDVVIEFDRLSEEQRKKLDEPRRSTPDASELVVIRVEQISFDLEYSKVVVPGEVRLTADDVEFRATDLELRLTSNGTGVEYLRVSRGGRIELRDASKRFGVEVPGERTAQSMPLTDWIRATLQAKVAVPPAGMSPNSGTPGVVPAAPTKAPEKVAEKSVKPGEEDLPIFRRGGGSAQPAKPSVPQHYFARFEGAVRASQQVGGVQQAELLADALEVLRQVTDSDRQKVQPEAEQQTPAVAPATEKPEELVVLEWSGRLLVETLPSNDPRRVDGVRARVTATGAPTKLSSTKGDALCARLVVEPDAGTANLYADDGRPVVLRSPNAETLEGREVHVRRSEKDFTIGVVGPGLLSRQSDAPVPTASESPEPDSIRFTERLDLTGRVVQHTGINLTGNITTEEKRVMDRAVFRGQVRMREGDTSAAADEIVVDFGDHRGGRGNQQPIERVQATGHVDASQGADRLTARELELFLSTDGSGRARPMTMIARGDVNAGQGERAIHARDTLRIEFEAVEAPSAEPAPGDVSSVAKAKGSNTSRSKVAVRRIVAQGEVAVNDPSQALDLAAANLDAIVQNGRELEMALIEGTADRPATVRTRSLSVTGERIKLNALDEWADVPGPGRMTFLANKDLDGEKIEQPKPIVVTWSDWMKYQGRENKATFVGNVHATSQSATATGAERTTTLDSERLLMEFDEASAPLDEEKPVFDWSIVRDLADRFRRKPQPTKSVLASKGKAKEPAYLLATGKVVTVMTELDTVTGATNSRASIRGPRMSLNLRKEVSKMLIEGAGNLLIEDFRPAKDAEPQAPKQQSLLMLDAGSGPNKTLIEWQDMMWYDFSIEQTRFEGDVKLFHFSGAELDRLVLASTGGSANPGRKTYLRSDVLTVDFRQPEKTASPGETRRMGRLSSQRLRQFQASGAVQLEDAVERLQLSAESVSFERERELLAVYGSQSRKARIVVSPQGEYPQDITAERFFYNLSTRTVEAAEPGVKRR